MARIEIDGVEIDYELLGPVGAPAAAITPGGRVGRDVPGIPEFGRALADEGLRVLLWDRPNCGASDLHFQGAGESSMQASFLLKLIRRLDLGPTALLGGSAGARLNLFAAKQNPEAISRMMLWWISGGLLSMMRLGSFYCCEPAEVASLRGMEAVAEMPIWSQQVASNPRNREILLGMDSQEFISVMERWAQGFVPAPDTPIRGISTQDFASMTMPVEILRGSPNDLFHPAKICEEVDVLLPNSRLVDPPWPLDFFAERINEGSSLFADWPLLAPQVADFMKR